MVVSLWLPCGGCHDEVVTVSLLWRGGAVVVATIVAVVMVVSWRWCGGDVLVVVVW